MCGGFAGVTHSVNVPDNYTYCEDDFIALYNYCVRKRNAELSKISSINQNYKIQNIDKILNEVNQKYLNDYVACDYNELCISLLSLLTEDEQEEINYGKLKN
jgi:hypothetical protein